MNDNIVEIILAAVITIVSGSVANLFSRIRRIETNQTRVIEAIESLNVGRVEDDLRRIEKEIARNMLSREDWVAAASRILGELEKQRVLLAKHDERLKYLIKRSE